MSVRGPLAIALFGWLLASATVAGRAEQLPIRTYTTADGLASDTVYGLLADSRGFLWFCTSDGLSRFDGYGMTTYTARDGLPDRRVSDVCETRDRSVRVGTAGGPCRFAPRESAGGSPFVVERLGDELKTNEVDCLLGTSDGALWCGTEGGLYRLEARDGGWISSRVDLGTEAAVNALAEDRWGGVWAGTVGEVRLVRRDGRVEAYSLLGPGASASVTSAYEDTRGALWVGTQYGICRSAPRVSAETPLALAEMDPRSLSGWGNAFFETRDGTLWAATTLGLWRETDAEASRFERRVGLDGACQRSVWDVAEDRDGNLWLATSCGVLRVARYGFTGYTKADGLVSTTINSIFEIAAGELVVTTDESKWVVHRFDGARFVAATANFPKTVTYLGWGWGQTVLQDREGAWWVPSGGALYRFPKAERPETAMRARPEAIFAGREVFRVFEDSRGDVWFSTLAPAGLLRWDRASGRIVDLTAEAGGIVEYTVFCDGPDGALWIGTGNNGGELAGNGGLLRYANGHFDRLTVADGVPAGWLRALYVDSRGRLWIASSLGGLARVDDLSAARPRFAAYTTAERLSSDNVWCVVEDAWGRIYAGTTRGVDRLDVATGSVKHYTSADGLPKSQPQCAFRDRNGSLWFGSVFGLARFDPEPERRREPPRTLVTGLRVAGVVRPVSPLGEAALPALELGPGENSMTLEFLGLGTSLGEELRYQYRLEGGEERWSAPSAERTVTFANLGPGSYRFLVRAVDAEGVASAEPAVVAFTIAAPVWRRWWFLVLAGGLAALAIYGLHRHRVARLVEIERVRTHIATDLHDDIGANLTKIAALSEVANYRLGGDGGDESLASIADISRESVTAMGDIVWAVDPGRDSVNDLTRRMRQFASEAFVARDTPLRFSAPEAVEAKLGDEQRRHIYLVFKEAVNNAVRHSGCGRADVTLGLDRGRLVLTISDDGRGFDTAAESCGNGLANMRKRAAAIGAALDVRSAEGRGTTITLSVPIRGESRFRRSDPPKIGR